jgi:hypothetical protein
MHAHLHIYTYIPVYVYENLFKVIDDMEAINENSIPCNVSKKFLKRKGFTNSRNIICTKLLKNVRFFI